MNRILLTVTDEDIAARIDRCVEVVIAEPDENGEPREVETLVMAEPSAEDICWIAISEKAQAVVCCGIDEEHYQFLRWKNIAVIDGVIGPWREAARLCFRDELGAGMMLSRSV